MNYVLEKNSESYELMGGKATALSKMGKAIDNIPDWLKKELKIFLTKIVLQ